VPQLDFFDQPRHQAPPDFGKRRYLDIASHNMSILIHAIK
jgi:hypothetical protein